MAFSLQGCTNISPIFNASHKVSNYVFRTIQNGISFELYSIENAAGPKDDTYKILDNNTNNYAQMVRNDIYLNFNPAIKLGAVILYGLREKYTNAIICRLQDINNEYLNLNIDLNTNLSTQTVYINTDKYYKNFYFRGWSTAGTSMCTKLYEMALFVKNKYYLYDLNDNLYSYTPPQ